MSSAQVGKTELILNVIGYHIDHDPAPILNLQPTLEMASTFSKDRLAPMLRDTPALRSKVVEGKAKTGGNTILKKDFHGGHITMAGANSPASLASRPIRLALLDEIDRYPASAGTEGSPVGLAVKRTTTFWNRKIVKVATPTVKGASAIESAFELSDQRYFFVPCPHCDEMQKLVWERIKFKDRDPDTAHYECKACKKAIHESDKYLMLRRGEWRSTTETKKVAGFHLSAIYSPWMTWAEIVQEFLDARGNREDMKVWTNTVLGETFDEAGEQLDHIALYTRREYYKNEVPEWVCVLGAGVDTQDDRLEVSVYGHGPSRKKEQPGVEHALIAHQIFRGDTSQPEVWAVLDQYLLRKFQHELGVLLTLSVVAVDLGGHSSEMVYKFTKQRHARGVIAVKGSNQVAQPLIGRRRESGQYKAPFYMVGTDTGKALVMSDLQVTETGGGHVHFPMDATNVDEEFFLQLTGEKRIIKVIKGRPTSVWKATRDRVEAVDCAVYERAGIALLNPDYLRLMRDIRRHAKPVDQVVETDEQKDPLSNQNIQKKRKKRRIVRKKRNFARNY